MYYMEFAPVYGLLPGIDSHSQTAEFEQECQSEAAKEPLEQWFLNWGALVISRGVQTLEVKLELLLFEYLFLICILS